MRLRRDDGVALLVALMMMALLGGLALSLTLMMVAETRIAAVHRDSVSGLHAAEAAAALALEDLTSKPDWNVVLGGHVMAAFIDGGPAGVRATPGGPLDLTAATDMIRCGRVSGCTEADISASTAERPWGPNNPRWQLYVYGRLGQLLPIDSPLYVVVWVGDDPAECDGTPEIDGAPCAEGVNPGANVLALRAHAYAAGGVVQQLQLTVGRAGPGSHPRVLSWRRIR